MKRKLLSMILCIAMLASFFMAFSVPAAAKTAFSQGAPSLIVNIVNPDGTVTLVHEYLGVVAGSYDIYDPDLGHNVTYYYYSYPELETISDITYYATIDAMPAAVGTKSLGVTISALVNNAKTYNSSIKWESGQKLVLYPTDSATIPYQSTNFYTYDFVQGQARYYYPNLVEKYTAYRENGEDTSYLAGWDADPAPVEPVLSIAAYQERYATDAMLKSEEVGVYPFGTPGTADYREIITPVTMDSKESIRFCIGLTPTEAQQGIANTYSSTNKFCRWAYRIDFGPINGPQLTADSTNAVTGQPIDVSFTDNETWRNAITGITVDSVTVDPSHYTLSAGTLTLDNTVFTANGSHEVIVIATGFMNDKVTQKIGIPPTLKADSTNNTVGQPIDITFTSNNSWQSAVSGVTLNGTAVTDYTVASGKITIPAGNFTLAGDYAVVVSATGYNDASVTQTLNALLTYTADAHGSISGTSPQTVAAGGSGTAVTATANSGYHFVKWSDESTANPRTDTNVTTSISVTASFAANTYTVSFDAQGGTAVSSQSLAYGSLVTAPADPTRESYIFGGWYREAACTTAWSFASDTVPGDITLYAKWNQGEITYAVTFISDGATYTLLNNLTSGTSINAPADPTRSGYNFGGWYFDQACTSPVTFLYTVTADTLMYAKWTCYYTYTTSGSTATITGYSGAGGAVVIPGAFTSGGISYTVTTIADGTSAKTSVFHKGKTNNTTITSVTIPDSLTTIGDFAFFQCKNLASINMSNNVTSIGKNAFFGTKLTSLDLPDNASLGEAAFYQCTALTSLTIPVGVTWGGVSVFCGCSGLTSLTLENGRTDLGIDTFEACTGLTSVTIPDSITAINNNVFNRCTGLVSITIPNSVTSIGATAFSGCTGLNFLTLPNNLATIGVGAFSDCTGLTTMVIPNSVTSLGDGAFDGCTGLTSITLSNNLSTIGVQTFNKCTALTSINIPASVTTISANAFNYCSALTSITIPMGVTSLGDTVFSSCSHLATAYFPGAKPTTYGATPFSGTASGFTLHYHVSQAASWSGYTAYNATPYCTLTLDPNYSGSMVINSNVTVTDNLIAAPDDPIRDGCTFGGWYKEPGCVNAFVFVTETVTNDLTLYARWIQYTISASVTGGNGTVSANPEIVGSGESCVITISPADGYHLAAITDNDIDVLSAVSSLIYTLDSITANHIVAVTFEPNTSTITTGTVTGGAIIADKTSAAAGETVTLTVTPDMGKRLITGTLSAVYNDGSGERTLDLAQTGPESWTFTMPAYAVTVTAEFEATATFQVTASVKGGHGAINAEPSTVYENRSCVITFVPNTGYQVRSLMDNGTEVVGQISNNTYTLNNVLANHTIVVTFQAIAAPKIKSFTPTKGGSGTAIIITGTNLNGATAVSIGGTAAASFTVDSDKQITAIAGSGTSGGISVTTPGGTANSSLKFSYYVLPEINSFTPAAGGKETTVTINGNNLKGTTSVLFGGTAALSFTVKSAVQITAKVGSGSTGFISLTTPGGTAESTSIFTYKYPAPRINSFTPTLGGSGTVVVITGSNFTNAGNLTFGGIEAASYTVNSATKITAIAGEGTTGNIAVTTPGGTAVSKKSFTYYYEPVITSFTPALGNLGTSVVISGAHFKGAKTVKIGGTRATSFKVDTDNQITAKVGKGSTGAVSVTTPGGTATSITGFTYYLTPKIKSFTPTLGGSGTEVAITGSNLNGTTGVNIGGTNAASFEVISDSRIRVVAGNGATGKITLTTPGGTAVSSGKFTYYAQPVISSFTPALGGADTPVTINGANLKGVTSVTIGGTPATGIKEKSNNQITVKVGKGSTGAISVTTPGGTATSTETFSYYAAPVINSFTPASGKSGTVIIITGSNFTGAITVSIGSKNASSFTVDSDSQITAIVGNGATGKITVITPGGKAVSSSKFTYK
jgi:uncharacterized repeat protein (TIGR02543 family)